MRHKTRALTSADAIHAAVGTQTILGKLLSRKRTAPADPVMLELLNRSLDIEVARIEVEKMKAENRKAELALQDRRLSQRAEGIPRG